MKKRIALLLALVLTLSLAACGGTTGTPETTAPTETAEPVAESAGLEFTDEMARATYTGIYDNPQWDGSLPLVQPGEDNKITIGLIVSANVSDYDDNAYTKWVEEQTGVDIQFVLFSGSTSDVKTQLSLMIASGEKLPDIILGVSLGVSTMKEYGHDGYLTNLASLFSTDAYYTAQALHEQYPDAAAYERKMTQFAANLDDPTTHEVYCFPANFMTPIDAVDNQMWINQDWLDALGLEAPTNPEELYEVLKAFRDGDPNGNGKKDELPMVGVDAKRNNDVIGYILNSYLYYLPTYKFLVENDTVCCPYDQPEYREGLIYINKLVSEGLISPMTWTITDGELDSLINADGDLTVGITATEGEHFAEGNPSVEAYVPMDYMDASTPRGGYYPLYDDTIARSTYITADCDNPRLAFRLLDFMNCGESYLRLRWGEKDVDWEYIPADEHLPGHSGGEAKIRILRDGVFQSVNNQTWHWQQTMASEGYWQIYQPVYDGSYNGEIYGDLQKQYENCMKRGQPEQVFYAMLRTEEEDAEFNEWNAELNEYVKSARAKFCVGEWDPSDDAAWESYLKELEGLHYYTAWVQIGQNVWDRMYKK
ncbi:MAG: extracellular solute-binding protein [Oscillospiraceae bacterium]|nr:extracellular solute-binding protein [Oscillospiraceae bacterium]